MSFRRLFTLSLVVTVLASQGAIGQPLPAPPPRFSPPSLLYVKISGPPGMKVTLYRGSPVGQTLEAPFVVGLRPGYRYRLAISDLPDFPGETFYPTLEARAGLILSDTLRHADFPAPLVFTDEDFFKASRNVTIKKALLLERPDRALPFASARERPFEIEIPPNKDLLHEARPLGQPLLLVHLGERKLEPAERVNMPGTILLPGEKVLPVPPAAPFLPWTCYPVFDPVLGPMHPADMLALSDGGDTGLRAGVTRDGKIVGLDPTDTIARYTDSFGTRRIAVSNRVGLCVPRFLLVRGESGLAAHRLTAELGGWRSVASGTSVGTVAASGMHTHRSGLEGFAAKMRASGTSTEMGLAITGRVEGIQAHVATRVPAGLDVTCPKPLASEPKDGPLQIIKWPDKCGALVGDLITFFVRYNNTGGQPMSGIIVADSLHTRYEYVPGSAKSDRAATFTTQPNEAGSILLRWEIEGTLAPGDSGMVSFQVRIR